MRIRCPKTHTFILPFFLLATLVLLKVNVIAKDECADIGDLDDRAKCYADQITKKQDAYESTSNKLESIRKEMGSISNKITSLSSQLNVTQGELDGVQNQINKINKELAEIDKKLNDRRGTVDEKTNQRNSLIRSYAKLYRFNLYEMFLSLLPNSQNGFSVDGLTYGFTKFINNQITQTITGLNNEIDNFEKDKAETKSLKDQMVQEQQELLAVVRDLANKKKSEDAKYSDLNSKEDSVERELSNIQKQIDELSSKQQAILSAKSGDGTGSVGDYESPKATTPEPPFKPAFASFSYGAYTHYNGMSQYGAKARADGGQNYKDILKFYYKTSTTEKKDFPSKISVQGYGEIDFQYYLYGLAEMPTNWPLDALKAQAIAGRTYAYKARKPICTTQSCQVFSKSKADKVKSGQYATWKKAVDDTEDEILSGDVSAQYSSTTGGYINNVGWDIAGKWPNDAYEKKAGSPWFYKAWYTKSYADGSTCGRNHPWLNEEEMADILNSWVVWRKGSNSDRDRISPVTTSCWGGNPYSLDDMAEKADKYGEKYTSVSSVSADISNGGYTSKVTFSTNRGSVSIEGDVFKTVFNLRAPSYLSIKSRLFDMEREN